MQFFTLASIVAAVSAAASASTDIVAVAKAANLTTLLTIIGETNLTSTVEGLTQTTVFAPTNAAFDAVIAFAKGANLTLTPAILTQILELHLVAGVYNSTAIVAAAPIPALATVLKGSTLNVTVAGGNVFVAGAGNTTPAKVIVADVAVNQGIVHVIDTVLLPDLSAYLTPAATTTATTSVPTSTYTTKPIAASASSSAASALLLAFSAMLML